MIELTASLVPPGVTAWAAGIMTLAALLGSFVTAAFGVGGGVLLLGVMTLFLPVPAVIPVHGVVQAGSNGGRTLLFAGHIRWPVLAAFAAGGLVGAALGSRVLVTLPEALLEIALGAFILVACWLPLPAVQRGSHARTAIGGALTTGLTLFVGATGPFVATLIRALHLDRRAHVATFSACMTLQHAFKLAVFGLAGFAFGPWVPWLGAMMVMVVAGTWLGRQVLERMDDRRFRRILSLLLTALALRLLYSGLTAPGMPLGSWLT
jgi:uncharacterized membrane protein YfcA